MPDEPLDVAADIKRLVESSKLPTRQQTDKIEVKNPEAQVHALLNDSIEKIAQEWIDQLKVVKENCDALESQVLAAITQTKNHIAKLHELGAHISEEAKRGRELCATLSRGVAQISDQQVK